VRLVQIGINVYPKVMAKAIRCLQPSLTLLPKQRQRLLYSRQESYVTVTCDFFPRYSSVRKARFTIKLWFRASLFSRSNELALITYCCPWGAIPQRARAQDVAGSISKKPRKHDSKVQSLFVYCWNADEGKPGPENIIGLFRLMWATNLHLKRSTKGEKQKRNK